MKKLYTVFIFLIVPLTIYSQEFSRKDSLRGSITPERAWWDLLHYDIEVDIDVDKKFISGKNTIQYKVLEGNQILHIDLQSPMLMVNITQDKEFLTYKKEGSAYFVNLTKEQIPGAINEIEVMFKGSPLESKNPPWDGGFVWRQDKEQNPFVANANQLVGSSIWLPSKDIPYDEPDKGMQISITSSSSLISVSNGKLIEKTSNKNGTDTYLWKVVNPINGYGINMNMGNYVHFKEVYTGEKGDLDLDYYVLKYNEKKAKVQFKQVPKMLEAFEFWFGPYPFYEDGFKLVEVPYLGMEHQSSVTYGNQYQNGYLGGDLSGTGEGLKFDFIIIHESGHEWFANSLTNYDVADMWIHEGFTTYSEVLYLDYHFGTESGNSYMIGIRDNIINNRPITGAYEVNYRGSNDMYGKGAAMIHTLRQIIDNDEKFRDLLRAINREYYHQTLTSKELENYIMQQTSLELQGFFDQYLRTIKVPVLEIRSKNGTLKYRFKNTVNNFKIPVKFDIDGTTVWLKPSEEWQDYKLPSGKAKVSVDPNFYLEISQKD